MNQLIQNNFLLYAWIRTLKLKVCNTEADPFVWKKTSLLQVNAKQHSYILPACHQALPPSLQEFQAIGQILLSGICD